MPRPIIPIFARPHPFELSADVPPSSANLFERIIRNPTAPNRPHRERRCAEMLCAVLLNCPQLRKHIFEKLGSVCGFENVSFSDLEYDIDTEQAIGGYRDDLRIVGYHQDDQQRKPSLLWTIEIKVQAGIHYSSSDSVDEDDGEPLAEAENVTQLENYDRWLGAQTVADAHKAGIVLSIRSLKQKVDDLIHQGKLKPRWHCLRWSDLSDWIQEWLERDSLPESEQVLARHLLCFVLKHLRL